MTSRIYVTGFHRAGTHAFAEYKAKELGISYIEEAKIGWNSVENAVALKKGKIKIWDNKLSNFRTYIKLSLLDGYVAQCPGLSHKAIELSKHGKVYWVTRNIKDVVTSMRNGHFNQMTWDLMKDLKSEFPDDPIWEKISYSDGRHDQVCNYVGYYTLFCNVKQYFYEKYLKPYVTKIITEEQSYYKSESTISIKRPMRPREQEQYENYVKAWEVLDI